MSYNTKYVDVAMLNVPTVYANTMFEDLIDQFEAGEFEPAESDSFIEETERYVAAHLLHSLGLSLGRSDEVHSGIIKHTRQVPSTQVAGV